MKPDYGMYLVQNGAQRDVALCLADIPLDHITLVSPNMFTSVMDTVLDGVQLSASFDFKMPMIKDVAQLAPKEVQHQLISSVDAMDKFPLEIDFCAPLIISIEAHIGEEVTNDDEVFRPLLVDRVFSASSQAGEEQGR